MATLLCMRPNADEVDYADARFIVCKVTGVNVGGKHYEMGDELPAGCLPERALREIYDTPLRLIETFEYAVQDEGLMSAMMRRMPVAEVEPDSEQEPAKAAPVATVAAKRKREK